MSKPAQSVAKLLILAIIALSLGVAWYGLKAWNSYNLRQIMELERDQAAREQAARERDTAVRDTTRLEIDLSSRARDRGLEPGPGPTVANRPKIRGVVEAVNMDDKLVVLSVGTDQNVQPGRSFSVTRGGKPVAKVKVIEVYPDLSGAKVLSLDGGDIEVGDKVVTEGE